MPQMDELADRLQVSKEELMEAVADTGYELVPTAGPADPAGMAGMEEDMAEEDMRAGGRDLSRTFSRASRAERKAWLTKRPWKGRKR